MKFLYNFALLCLIFTFNLDALALKNISPKGVAQLDEIIGIIKERHIKTLSEAQLIEAATNGILASLDSYSYFYDSKSLQELNTYTSGEFCGIGIEVKLDKGKAVVITPLTNSPAARAGILAGDRIMSINGTLIEGMTEQTIMKHLLGPPNTKISLMVLRSSAIPNRLQGSNVILNGDGYKALPIKVSMTREQVGLPSITSTFSSDGIFYLKIGAFYENTSKAMEKIESRLKSLQSKNQINGIIIDLRNNPGGLLEQAVTMSNIFIKKGKLVSIFSPKTQKNTDYLAEGDSFKLDEKIPIVVLINKGTASAAEVLAGIFKDHKRAILIGEKSFGKGSVQKFMPLSGGGALSITTALYKTPAGIVIENVGISPDINISTLVSRALKKTKDTGPLDKKISKKENDDFSKRKYIINKAAIIMTNKHQ